MNLFVDRAKEDRLWYVFSSRTETYGKVTNVEAGPFNSKSEAEQVLRMMR